MSSRSSQYIPLFGALLLLGILFLALASIIENWAQNGLREVQEAERERQARLYADFLGQALAMEDDLLLLNTLGSANKLGFHRGVVYDINGKPLYASQPRTLSTIKPLSPGFLEAFHHTPAFVNWSYDQAGEEASLHLSLHDGREWHGVLRLDLPRLSLSANQRVRLRLVHFLAFILCLAVSAALWLVERKRMEKTSPVPAQPLSVRDSGHSSGGDVQRLFEFLWKVDSDHVMLTEDNRVCFASPSAQKDFGAKQGAHLLQLEAAFPDDVEGLVVEPGDSEITLKSKDGREWRLAAQSAASYRLLVFTPLE